MALSQSALVLLDLCSKERPPSHLPPCQLATQETAMICLNHPLTACAAAAGLLLTLMLPLSAAPAADEKVSVSTPDVELTPEEKAEKQARSACKADICSAFRGKKATGGDIACNVVKS
jgi:hypothetical protein